MKIRNLLAASAAVSLAAAPAVAQSADAVRTAAPVAGESELGEGGSGSGIVLAVLAAAAVIGGIIIAVDNDDDDVPDSP